MDGYPHALEVRIQRLKDGRPRKVDRGQALAEFLPGYFDRTYSRPYGNLSAVRDAWLTLCPEHLSGRTAATSLNRGVLVVKVDSPTTGYELERLLSGGLETELRTALGRSGRGHVLRGRIRIVVEPGLFRESEARRHSSGRSRRRCRSTEYSS